MLIAGISDIHGNLIPYPSDFWEGIENCELLCICGDILPLHIQRNMIESKNWIFNEFKPWAESLPVEKIIFIGGNHDFLVERSKEDMLFWFPEHSKITYLHNTGIEYISTQDSKIYKIFGSPYCHKFGSWAFMRDTEILKNKFKEIPENIDILITHDAPYGVSDICYEGRTLEHIGNPELRNAILEKQPLYNLKGHLHTTNRNIEMLGKTKVVSCSILNEQYEITYLPQILNI